MINRIEDRIEDISQEVVRQAYQVEAIDSKLLEYKDYVDGQIESVRDISYKDYVDEQINILRDEYIAFTNGVFGMIERLVEKINKAYVRWKRNRIDLGESDNISFDDFLDILVGNVEEIINER